MPSTTTMLPPTPGTERYELHKRAEHDYTIKRHVWTDQGQSHVYDYATRDFLTWAGSWALVEVLGPFSSPTQARDHMIARDKDEG